MKGPGGGGDEKFYGDSELLNSFLDKHIQFRSSFTRTAWENGRTTHSRVRRRVTGKSSSYSIIPFRTPPPPTAKTNTGDCVRRHAHLHTHFFDTASMFFIPFPHLRVMTKHSSRQHIDCVTLMLFSIEKKSYHHFSFLCTRDSQHGNGTIAPRPHRDLTTATTVFFLCTQLGLRSIVTVN